MNVLIIGAGIGGLTAARALALRGHAVSLVERAPAFRATGAGIILGANALAVLRALGVDPRPAGCRLDTLALTDEAGRVLTAVPPLPGDVGEQYALHRAELHAVLVDALPPGVEVHLGAEVDRVDARPDAVEVHVGGRAHNADLVIGADGLHSRVRAALHPEVRVVYSGQTCWRAVVPALPLPGGVEALGAHGHRFGLVPLAGDRAYIFLVSHAPAHAEPPPWEVLQARFGAFGGLPAQVWPAVRPDDLLHHDLSALSAPVWGTPRAWLLGDAAHAMTPNLGQGAAMAIEDAAALALALGPDLPAAHARYVADRHRRVVHMQANSDRVGRVNAARHPITRWLRDAVLRSTPDWVAARVQRGVVHPGIALAARWAG